MADTEQAVQPAAQPGGDKMKQSLVLLGTTQQQDPAQAAPELFAQLHQPSLALVLLFISPAYDLALLARLATAFW
jgi:hypothetical protein